MPPLAALGATIACPFGVAPSALDVMPPTEVLVNGMPVATIAHFIPLDCIPTFGECDSLANPEVATATAAALGVLTPMPCIPMTTDPWVPGAPTFLIDGMPALNEGSICVCDFGGVIALVEPGQVQVTAP